MVDTVVSAESLRKRIVNARAVGDSEFEQTALDAFVALGQRLDRALRRYGDLIAEAATYGNAKRLRELHEGLHALRLAIIEWRLVAEELGVFTANANGSNANGSADGGGGGCCPSPVAAPFQQSGGGANASDSE